MNLFTVRTPCGVRPRDRDTGSAADSLNGSIPAFTLRHDNGALSGYDLMNQRCQRFRACRPAESGVELMRDLRYGVIAVAAVAPDPP